MSKKFISGGKWVTSCRGAACNRRVSSGIDSGGSVSPTNNVREENRISLCVIIGVTIFPLVSIFEVVFNFNFGDVGAISCFFLTVSLPLRKGRWRDFRSFWTFCVQVVIIL